MNLLEKSDLLQKAGRRVAAALDFERRWSAAGKVVPVGSARFGLMTTPNLDYEIYTDRPTPQAGFAVALALAAVPGVTGIDYRNFLNTDDPGLYWQIDYRDETGLTWDIDAWLVPFDHPHAGMAEAFAAAMNAILTDETRERILTVKAAARAEGPVRGIDVYKAVIAGGVRTLADFRIWTARHPPAKMETWRPKTNPDEP